MKPKKYLTIKIYKNVRPEEIEYDERFVSGKFRIQLPSGRTTGYIRKKGEWIEPRLDAIHKLYHEAHNLGLPFDLNLIEKIKDEQYIDIWNTECECNEIK